MSEAEVSIPEKQEIDIPRRNILKGLGIGIFGAALASALPKAIETVGDYLSGKENAQNIAESDLILEENHLPSDYNYDFRFPLTPMFSGADSCTSIKKGKDIYTFYSDTFQGGTLPPDDNGKSARPDNWTGTNMINNSLIIWDTEQKTYKVATRETKEGMSRAWISPRYNDKEEAQIEKENSANSFYWMQPPILDSSGKKISMLMSRMVNNPNKDNAIAGTFIGNDLVTYDVSDETSPVPQVESIIPLPRVNNEKRETSWGAGMMTMQDKSDGKTYTYIYASNKELQNNPWHTKDLRLARVEGDITNLSQWQFWDGEKWVEINSDIQKRYNQEKNNENFKELFDAAFKTAEDKAASIIDISSGFSVNYIDGTVVIVNKKLDLLEGTIDVIKSDSPTGPFTIHSLNNLPDLAPHTHKTETGKEFQEVTYLAYLHPEVVHPTTGKMPITLCSNVIGEGAEEAHKEDSERYMVKTFWVTKDELLNTPAEAAH